MLSALRQPRRARLLRRAAQSSGPSGVPAVRGMRPPQPGRIPRQGPVYQRRQPAGDSASPAAALPLPPGTRESPPHRPRRRHAQRDAPAKRGGKRGTRVNGSSGRWEIPRTGNSPSEISGSLRSSFGRGLWRGKSRASSVPRGGKQPKAVSSSNALFQARRWETLPSASSSQPWHDADLTASAWHTSHMEGAIPGESMPELPQQPPAPLLSPRFL